MWCCLTKATNETLTGGFKIKFVIFHTDTELHLISLTLKTTHFPALFLFFPFFWSLPHPCNPTLLPPRFHSSLSPSLTFFLLPFYLPPLLALSWRPVVKYKHDWVLSQRGSTPISSSPALILQSRPLPLIPLRRWWDSLQNQKSSNCFHETNSREKTKEDLMLFKSENSDSVVFLNNPSQTEILVLLLSMTIKRCTTPRAPWEWSLWSVMTLLALGTDLGKHQNFS